MKPIATQRDLILKHAAEGDPSAFLSLFGSQLSQMYAGMRSRGVPHKQALTTMATEVRALYWNFVRSKPKQAPEQWFEKQTKRIAVSGEKTDSSEIFIGSIATHGTDEFEASIHRVLQREYSVLHGPTGRRFMGRWGSVLAQVRIGRIILAAAGALLLLVGLETLLSRTGTGISVTLVLPRHIVTLSFPLTLEDGLQGTRNQEGTSTETPPPPDSDSLGALQGGAVIKASSPQDAPRPTTPRHARKPVARAAAAPARRTKPTPTTSNVVRSTTTTVSSVQVQNATPHTRAAQASAANDSVQDQETDTPEVFEVHTSDAAYETTRSLPPPPAVLPPHSSPADDSGADIGEQ